MKTSTSIKLFPLLLLSFLFFSHSIQAQSIEVKGIVKAKIDTETEVLPEVNVYLKNSSVGTSTNRKGEFTFPKKLNIGDVLVFSYLGFQKKQIKIKANSTYLNVFLEEDDNTLLGALNSNKRYKSKRSRQ